MNNPQTIGDLFNAMLASMQRMEQKIDFILSVIEHSEEDFDDANLSPFGKQRDDNQPL